MFIQVAEGFSGTGGFRLGLEKANELTKTNNRFKIVWANDCDKYAGQVYRHHYGSTEFTEKDICEISTDDIPNFDIFVGGFPCQPHSLAGHRKGFGEKRGEVFYEIVRIAKAKRPPIILLENVKGLLSSEEGRAFGTVMEELGNLGYWCEWQNLNSQYHGVPQNRPRVFIVFHLRERCTEGIFPLSPSSAKYVQYTEEDPGQEVSWAIRSRDYKDGTNFLYTPKIKVYQEHSFSGEGGRGRGLRVFDGYSPTLSGQMGTGGNNVPIIDMNGFRKFTPRECERLQGMPDDWTAIGRTVDDKEVKISNTQRYKMCGNAVTVNVITVLGLEILKIL